MDQHQATIEGSQLRPEHPARDHDAKGCSWMTMKQQRRLGDYMRANLLKFEHQGISVATDLASAFLGIPLANSNVKSVADAWEIDIVKQAKPKEEHPRPLLDAADVKALHEWQAELDRRFDLLQAEVVALNQWKEETWALLSPCKAEVSSYCECWRCSNKASAPGPESKTS